VAGSSFFLIKPSLLLLGTILQRRFWPLLRRIST
jgi:hypothetical protein